MLSFLFFISSLHAASPNGAWGKTQLPELLTQVEAKYSTAKTVRADFSQVEESAALKQKKTSSGMIEVKTPGKLKWETKTPFPSLLVSDGKKFWFYTPPFDEGDAGKVVERKSSDVQSRVLTALLSGKLSSGGFKVTEKSKSEYVLTPKAGTAGSVKTAQIHVDPEKKQIDRVLLTHRGGNQSEISLQNIELGKTISDDEFKLHVPKNTDWIQE